MVQSTSLLWGPTLALATSSSPAVSSAVTLGATVTTHRQHGSYLINFWYSCLSVLWLLSSCLYWLPAPAPGPPPLSSPQ